jgi:hypothetical protein
MRKSSAFLISVYFFAAAVSARAQPQDLRYVYDGKILQIMQEDPGPAKYKRWQIWLYQEGVRIPRYATGLQYSRWGLIEGNSAENVIKQVQASQSFEAAYLKFFGPGTWGRYTFFNPVGPIAVTDQALEDQPTALEKLYQLRWLHERVNKLIGAVRPSLENNQSQGPTSSVEGYLIRSETLSSESANFTASYLAIAPNFGSSRVESFRQKYKCSRQRTTCRKLRQSCRV